MKSPTPITHDHFQLDVKAALKAGLIVRANQKLLEQAGYRVRVMYSATCHARHVEWLSPDTSQDEVGRAWDVLGLAAFALRLNANEAGQATTGIESVPPGGKTPQRDDLRVAWLGDEHDDPVVLIMLATETVRGINTMAKAGANNNPSQE